MNTVEKKFNGLIKSEFFTLQSVVENQWRTMLNKSTLGKCIKGERQLKRATVGIFHFVVHNQQS